MYSINGAEYSYRFKILSKNPFNSCLKFKDNHISSLKTKRQSKEHK